MLTVPLLILLGLATAWDLRQRRIPNLLVLAGALAGGVIQLTVAGLAGLQDALLGLLLGFGLLLPGYILGTTGAGDVKLMAAIGTFLGPYNVFLAVLASIIVGSLVALGYAASALFSPAAAAPWARYGLMFKTLIATGRPIYLAPAEGEVMGRKFPFAVSIALGTAAVMFWQSPLREWIG